MSLLGLSTLAVWLYLFFAHGRFWRSTPELAPAVPASAPDVDVVVPARDEAATIGAVVASLLAQDYAGITRVIVVDDSSRDGTAERAGTASNLTVIHAKPKPHGWTGKLWALDQGVAASSAPLLLFADADIVHDPRHLSTLVARLDEPRVDLVSEMVRLNCDSVAERLLIPAFVYFFQMLYPFAKANDPACAVAAAAGGTVLIRREAVERIGGIASIKDALIDDVTLARAVKQGGAIFLGHSQLAVSLRPYPRFRDIWDMVSRTAFTQLRHSGFLLAIALCGLVWVWWLPLAVAMFGHGAERCCGIAAFALSAVSYVPTLRRYHRQPLWSLGLPLVVLFYMGATLASALAYWRGSGAQWKGRDYPHRSS